MSEYASPEYSIPHCTYRKTSDGFTVNFTRPSYAEGKRIITPLRLAGIIAGWFVVPILVGTILRSFGSAVVTFFACVGVSFVFLFKHTKPPLSTYIKVTKDAITVDRTTLRRTDFRHFFHGVNEKTGDWQLAYVYGERRVFFGGSWEKSQVDEFASALNRYTDMVSTGPSAEELRNSLRSTDF